MPVTCPSCDAEKLEPFGRCPACGHLPRVPFDDPPETWDRGPQPDLLRPVQGVLIGLLMLLLGPLPGIVLLFGWRAHAPRAARLVLGLTLFAGALHFVAWAAFALSCF